MDKVLILGDERKGRVRQLISLLEDRLHQKGLKVEVELERDSSLVSREADLVLVCGGDGSLLAAARRMGTNQMPTVGINLGRLGFLTAFSDAEATEAVDQALAGKLSEEPRLMLSCHIERVDGTVTEPVLGLNDGVLCRSSAGGIITISAFRKEHELATYTGDGLIVSTPVGSTAYSLSAGGPILSPRMEALVLSPLASHSLTLRPLVVPLDEGVQLVIQESGGAVYCPFMVDGQISMDVAAGDRVILNRAAVCFRHLTRGPRSFFETLREKFGWADTHRRLDSED
ncbi:MAG: NAD(+)/NADH kinase [Planctomycetota bacterium]|jgi:NAD+ kinase